MVSGELGYFSQRKWVSLNEKGFPNNKSLLAVNNDLKTSASQLNEDLA